MCLCQLPIQSQCNSDFLLINDCIRMGDFPYWVDYDSISTKVDSRHNNVQANPSAFAQFKVGIAIHEISRE
jgi:hypothetical protein